jgi:hypothetical protein
MIERNGVRRIFWLLATLALGAYAVLLIRHVGTGVGGSDASGYANTARDIVSGRIVVPVEPPGQLGLPDRFARAFIPLAHEPGPRPGTMVPFYPPGFPLHVALGGLVGGWQRGPFLVTPILAVVCLVLTHQLGRELSLSRPLAFAGAAILGLCPVFLFQAVQPMSDVAAAAWAVAAILCALRSGRGDGWALAAGAAFGVAVLVRPTDVLLAAPLAVALSWRPRTLASFVVGGFPSAVFLALWNHAAFGSAMATGYSGLLAGELALGNFTPRVRHYSYWILAQLSPLVVLGWLAAPLAKHGKKRDAAMLIIWFAAFFSFYCFWGPFDAWWYTRYFIPALPALILGFLLALRALSLPRRGLVIAAALVVVATFEWRTYRRQRPLGVGPAQSVFRDASLALSSKAAGKKALVVSMEFSGAIRFHTDLAPLRWDFLTPEDFGIVRARAAEEGWRVFAVLLPHEVEKAALHVPGEWKFLENVGRASLWELPPP